MASLVQQVPGSATSLYGIATTQISTQAGSWLAVAAGWNCITAGSLITVPAVNVTDSAGNLWRQAAISGAGSAATRCAVWVAPNALPVSWVSVGLTGFAASAAWTVAEISGMPQAAGLDFSVFQSGSGTAPSLPWTASGADVGFAAVVAGNAAETVSAAPGGWSALGSAAAGSAATGCALFSWWNPGIAAGGGTTAVTLTSSQPYSYALCVLSASASPPPQQDVNFPLVQVEAAFDAQPGNVSASVDYLFSSEYASWTDLSSRAIGPAVQSRIKTKRGRQYQLQQQETGTCEISLSNVDGAFTPTNPGSPYYSSALNANMSFQSGIGGWSPSTTAALAQSSAFAYASGLNAVAVYSMQVTPSAGHSGAMAAAVPVNPNYPYTGSAWFYSPGGYALGGHIQVNWYTSGGTFISTSTGPNIALPAGVWTFVSYTGITPPSNAGLASIIVSLNGSPTSANVFYVAEAALVTGPAVVQTGLVTPVTPVRVTAWWQGRRYPLWMGYAQAWPQEWPDMPQWGWTALKAADALGAAAAGPLQSALIGEVLIDNPYAYLPCNESYTAAVNGATPANPFIVSGGYLQPTDASGLAAVNRANGNQVSGVYLDGTNMQVSTGLAMNFLGDNGTGMGATGYSGQVSGQRGPSMLYTDPGIATIVSSACTFEFWFTWGGTSSQFLTLLTLFGNASAFWAPSGTANGAAVVVTVSNDGIQVTVQGATFGGPSGVLTASQSPQHLVLTFNAAGTSMQVYLNGQNYFTQSISGYVSPLKAVLLGPGRYSYDCNNGLFADLYEAVNYAAGHLAIYGYTLPANRVLAHYQAGATGWQGTDAATRSGQILTWAQLGLKRGGYNYASATGTPEVTGIGPAYSLSGQPANSAEYAVAQSEGGRYGTQANGSLIYLERPAGYNLPVSATFADGTAAAPYVLNADPGFATGLAGWTGPGTLAYAPGSRYGSLGAIQAAGGTAGLTYAQSPSFAYNGGSADAGFWLNSPSGVTVVCAAAGAAGAGTATLSPGAWTFVPVTFTGGAGPSASLYVQSQGTSALLIAWAGMWYSTGQVPYQPKQSYGFDQTYIYNEVQATQQDGPNQLVLYDARGTASQAQFFRRSALTFQPNVVSAYDVSDITTWSLAGYQQPSMHVSAITVDAASNPLGAFSVILRDLAGQVAQVNRNPVGGAPLAGTGTVERSTHDIGPGYWQAGYQLSPYGPSASVLCADTAGYDAPGTTPSLVIAW